MKDLIMDFTRHGMKDRAMVRQKLHTDYFGLPKVPGSQFFVDTSFAFGDPRAQTIWSDAVYEYGLENMFFTPFLGSTKDKNALIVMDSELLTKKGGTMIFEARNVLEGGGQGDDGNTTGNEQQIKRRNMSMTVHQRQTSTVSAG